MLLAKDPGLQDELRHDISLVPAFIEEVVRLESPFQGHYRVTTQDTDSVEFSLRRVRASDCSGARPIVTKKSLKTQN